MLLNYKGLEKSYELLMDNFIKLNVIIDKYTLGKIDKGILDKSVVYQKIAANLNYWLMVEDSFLGKQAFGSVNEAISKIKMHYGKNFNIFSDSNYVEWCLVNLQNYYFSPDDIRLLESKLCHHFYGIGITWVEEDIFKMSIHSATKNFKFNDRSISENLKKWEENYNIENDDRADSYSRSTTGLAVDDFSELHSDGYGGYLDDDFINDALDGDPDAHWNID